MIRESLKKFVGAGLVPARSAFDKHGQGQALPRQKNPGRLFHFRLILVALGAAFLCWWLSPTLGSMPARVGVSRSEQEVDAALERASVAALQGREGVVLVMDAQTGRLRAVVNSRTAFAESFPPGSTIKPFTALAALRTRLIEPRARLACPESYTRGDFEISCAHAPHLAPFDLRHALGYSCNHYFGKLGERINRNSFDETLQSFGFGATTGVGAEEESGGRLARDVWPPGFALGEGEHLLVTPAQLLTAYAALVNGGHLFSPREGTSSDFLPRERAKLYIAPADRAALIDGMRGAIEYGTAEKAMLNQLPLYIFGKTGTATEVKGFRTHGWFVGFAADFGAEGADVPPSSIKLAVLVFLKRAHGADCAVIARTIFEEWAVGSGQWAVKDKSAASVTAAVNCPLPTAHCPLLSVRVKSAGEGRVHEVSLEEYILGVVAAEGSTEGELEALKALAVASRTYAVRNRGRHASEGFDFCTLTHCQRYAVAEDGGAEIRDVVRRAVNETAGQVLKDERNEEVVDAYFSASCGGMTANVETLWGSTAPAHLRGVRDDYCATGPHHNWTDAIAGGRLLTALQSDPRSDVGARLDDVKVIKRDATGRAEWVMLEGERRRRLRGWDLKMIVGRSLGWNWLKSSRFEIRRAGSSFVFRGGGFGHGVGLCQEGAHVMAERGASYRRILGYYFPGTIVGPSEEAR